MAEPHAELERNVRRTVAASAMHRMHRLLHRWDEEERRGRRVALVLAALLAGAVILAAAFWFGGASLITIG